MQWKASTIQGMKITRVGIAGIAVSAAALLGVGGVWAVNSTTVEPPVQPVTSVVEQQPVVTPTATPTATPEPPAAPVVEAPVEAPAPPADPGPTLCPSGSTANSSDGYNDTSCYPDICFSIAVPDPAHPECDYAFKP